MNILDNELVKHYFHCECHQQNNCAQGMALRVLTAMQEPIRNGDKLLRWSGAKVIEETALTDYQGGESPRLFLRLPSRFQETEKKECEREDAKLLMETHLHVFHSTPAELKPAPSEKEKIRAQCCSECGETKYTSCSGKCECHKPSGEVEEKIKETIDYIEKNVHHDLAYKLRELMATMRKETY